MKRNNIILFILSWFLFSCSHNYEESVLDEEFSEKTPDSILYNFKEVVVEEGKLSYSLEADKAETFGKKKATVFSDLYFVEYNSSGEISTEGACVEAEYFSDTDNIDFRKKIVLNAAEQGYFIEGEYLFWDNSRKSLSGKDGVPVRIGKDDGSYIEGYGFSSSSESRSFSFSGKTKGKYVSSD